jgi:hypothetical protein
MHTGAWEVWLYAPSGGRKLVDRFNRRNEAEHHKARLGRLIGNPALLTVCFDPLEANPPTFQNFQNF